MSDKSADKSARIVVRVRLVQLNGEVAGHAAEVGDDVRIGVGVGVRVGPMEFQLIPAASIQASLVIVSECLLAGSCCLAATVSCLSFI